MKKGTLIIIGGGEDKDKEPEILREVAKRVKGGKLVVATVASSYAKESWADYRRIFRRLGVKHLQHLSIEHPDEARAIKVDRLFDGATGFFFTGGDQMKITTKLGGSPILNRVIDLYEHGGVVAGTSAGAAIMGAIMFTGKGNAKESHKVGNWRMAPGLGLLKELIVDQHFAQRARIGRLLSAVSTNPGVLGVGIDENTAVVVEKHLFRVIGENAVYVIDGKDVTHTNVSQAAAKEAMSIYDVHLHILGKHEVFDLRTRRPHANGHAAS